jgi:DNA-binding NarL/FixJ family response regulator
MESDRPVRVVSDMNPVVRAVVVGPPTQIGGLSTLLAELNGTFEVFGPVWPPSAVFAQVLQHSPDLLLVDYDAGASDTRDLIRNVRARFPAMKVIVLGSSETAEDVREAIRAGVGAYLPRNCGAEDFTSALWALQAEHTVLGNDAARRLFATEVSRTPLRRAEVQVLRLLAEGLTYDEITAQLEISRSTLKRYLNHIETKLNARNRVQAVAEAAKQGLI